MDRILDAIPINWRLIGNPLNWLIILLMVMIAGFAFDQAARLIATQPKEL
jgi:hypothetical protein